MTAGITVSPRQLEELMPIVLKEQIVPNVLGSPSVGKSSIIKQIADKYNLQFIDIRLATMDITDLNNIILN